MRALKCTTSIKILNFFLFELMNPIIIRLFIKYKKLIFAFGIILLD